MISQLEAYTGWLAPVTSEPQYFPITINYVSREPNTLFWSNCNASVPNAIRDERVLLYRLPQKKECYHFIT